MSTITLQRRFKFFKCIILFYEYKVNESCIALLLALKEESSKLISEALSILPCVPGLCTPEASVNVLPSVLYLLTCALREVASIQDSTSQKTVSAALQALKQLTTSAFTQHPKCSKDWIDLLQRFKLFICRLEEGQILIFLFF